jgi:hypothetical protein
MGTRNISVNPNVRSADGNRLAVGVNFVQLFQVFLPQPGPLVEVLFLEQESIVERSVDNRREPWGVGVESVYAFGADADEHHYLERQNAYATTRYSQGG